MRKFNSIAVYCGSSPGNNPVYKEMAIALSELLFNEGITLINGGGRIGIMGIMADEILKRGGRAIGVIPMGLKTKEVAHDGMTELITVADMHSRKLTMVNLSDAFIVFPGGFGTLDECFETLTWAQLHLHHKPILLLNINNFFDALISQMDLMVKEGFLRKDARGLLIEVRHINEIMVALRNFVPASESMYKHSSS